MLSSIIRKLFLLPLTLGITLAMPGHALAQSQTVSPEMIAKVHAVVDSEGERLTAIFKDLHQHPELAFTEVRTAGIVAKRTQVARLRGHGKDRQNRRRRNSEERPRPDGLVSS